MNNFKHLENIFKGVANHWRVKILHLLQKNPGLSVEGVAMSVDGQFMTISEHLRKLARSGLVEKRYKGKSVLHFLTSRGKDILTFCKMLK